MDLSTVLSILGIIVIAVTWYKNHSEKEEKDRQTAEATATAEREKAETKKEAVRREAEAARRNAELRDELSASRQVVIEQSRKLAEVVITRDKLRDEQERQRSLSVPVPGTELKPERPPTTQEEEAEVMAKFGKHADRILALQKAELAITENETKARERARSLNDAVRPHLAHAVEQTIEAIQKVGAAGGIHLTTPHTGTVPANIFKTFDEIAKSDTGDSDQIVYSVVIGGGDSLQVKIRTGMVPSPPELMRGSYEDETLPDGIIRPPYVLIWYTTSVPIPTPNTGFGFTIDGKIKWQTPEQLKAPDKKNSEQIFSVIVDLIAKARVEIAKAKSTQR